MYLGNHYRYIESCAKEASLTPVSLLRVMKDVESVLNLILKRESVGPEKSVMEGINEQKGSEALVASP